MTGKTCWNNKSFFEQEKNILINKNKKQDTIRATDGFIKAGSVLPIGAISNMQVYRTPVTGETVVTEINVLQEVFNITLVHAVVKCGDEIIAQTDLKIALGDDAAR